jgi:hypothetical protein
MTTDTRILFYEGIDLSNLRMGLFCGDFPWVDEKIPGLDIRPLSYRGVNAYGNQIIISGYSFYNHFLTPEANKIITASFGPDYSHCNVIAYAMTYGSGYGGIVREMQWYMQKPKGVSRIDWWGDKQWLRENPHRLPALLKKRLNCLNSKKLKTA